MESPPPVIVAPPGTPRASVILLHGLGADGHDFEPAMAALGLPPSLGVRFVLPHAPVRPVTINGGMPMRAWFDIRRFDFSEPDEAGIRSAGEAARALVEAERALGIRPERIVLAGFSQGGAIALHAALRYPERLAGVLALSTLLPLAATLPAEASAANRGLPIFLAHGDADRVVPLHFADHSHETLRRLGYPVALRIYPMAHAVCTEELADLRECLLGWLA